MLFDQTVKPEEVRREAIEQILIDLGMHEALKGHLYLKEALLIATASPNTLDLRMQHIYSELSAKYGTSPTCIERAMRHAINTTWVRGNINKQQELFRYTIDPQKGKPTNKEFIALIANRINRMLS